MILERNGFFAWSYRGVYTTVRRSAIEAIAVKDDDPVAAVWTGGRPFEIDAQDAEAIISALMEETTEDGRCRRQT